MIGNLSELKRKLLPEPLDNDSRAALVLFLAYLAAVACFTFSRYNLMFVDDQLYGSMENLVASVLHRYQTWSSRLLIDASAIFFCKHARLLFVFLNIAVLCAIPLSLYYICRDFLPKKHIWAIFALLLCYDCTPLESAGLITTSLNYSWPLSFLLLGVACSLYIYKHERMPARFFAPLCLLWLYANNQEQACILAIASIGAVSFAFFRKHRRVNRQLAVLLAICCLGLAIAALCPGNYSRYSAEAAKWYPDFHGFSAFYKAYLGFISTSHHYFFEVNVLYAAFAMILAFSFYARYKGGMNDARTLYIFSPVLLPVFALVCSLYFNYSPGLDYVIDAANFTRLYRYVLLALSVFLLSALAFSLYHALRGSGMQITALAILCLGFATRAAMGFSPTLFASVNRTYLFMDCALVLTALIIIGHAKELPAARLRYILLPCALTQTVHTIVSLP